MHAKAFHPSELDKIPKIAPTEIPDPNLKYNEYVLPLLLLLIKADTSSKHRKMNSSASYVTISSRNDTDL